MAFLIDTHSLIWYLEGHADLPPHISSLLHTTQEVVFVSVASLWEITIKHSIGKLSLNGTLEQYFDLVRATGFIELPVTQPHLLGLAQLPFYHKDPFDRLLIAQAVSENLIFISKDKEISAYPVRLFW